VNGAYIARPRNDGDLYSNDIKNGGHIIVIIGYGE
jgi:hypothetical protein